MGVIKQGILGGFSNKVGAVVGSSWKGIAVMKSKPISVANPRTTGQVNQRNKMKGLTQFLSPILASWIKPLVDRFAVKQSGFNKLTSLNIANMLDNGIPQYGLLSLSQGKLSAPNVTAISADESDMQIVVSWITDLVTQFDADTDILHLVAFNIDKEEWVAMGSGSARSVGTASFDITGNVTVGDQLAVYLAFKRTDGTYVSNSAIGTPNVVA